MRAVRLFGHKDVRIVEIDKPEPRDGEILIKIAAAGVCHSDLHLIDHDTLGKVEPFTLGHENAGWIEELGSGATGFKKGDPVAVYGPWGCGHCIPCQKSMENYCDHTYEHKFLGGGLGFNGGMADYMIVPSSRLLVPLGNLDPKKVAPLTDAGLTPYHAIKRSASKITPSSIVLVQGIGGLGHMALQILKKAYAATVIACDISDDKLETAKKFGADHMINSSSVKDAVPEILKITGSKKCAVVLDFVGTDETFELGSKVIGLNGDWTVVGLAGGKYEFQSGKIPYGASLCTPYWGSRVELMEVLDLARNGIITLETEEYPLEQILEVYDRLRARKIKGRAVLLP